MLGPRRALASRSCHLEHGTDLLEQNLIVRDAAHHERAAGDRRRSTRNREGRARGGCVGDGPCRHAPLAHLRGYRSAADDTPRCPASPYRVDGSPGINARNTRLSPAWPLRVRVLSRPTTHGFTAKYAARLHLPECRPIQSLCTVQPGASRRKSTLPSPRTSAGLRQPSCACSCTPPWPSSRLRDEVSRMRLTRRTPTRHLPAASHYLRHRFVMIDSFRHPSID